MVARVGGYPIFRLITRRVDVICCGSQYPIKYLETPIIRVKFLLHSQMPFPYHTGHVTALL